MIKSPFFFLLIFIVSCQKNSRVEYDYPGISNYSTIQTLFDVSYTNHFENLEDFKNDSIISWFKKQDSISGAYFNNTDFERLLKRYDSLENKESDSARMLDFNESGLTFYVSNFYNGKEVDYDLLWVKNTQIDSEKIVFDSQSYKDGTYSIEYYKPSYDGKYVAIALGKTENFFNDLVILNTSRKELIGKPILNTKPEKAGGIKWLPDNKSIVFIAYPNLDNDRNSYTVLLNVEDGSNPREIFRSDEALTFSEEFYPVPMCRSQQSNFIFIYLGNASDFWDCYYLPIEEIHEKELKWKKLYAATDSIYHDWGTERNSRYYYKRVKNNNIQLCEVDLKNPDFENAKILVSGKDEKQVSGFKITKKSIFYTLTSNGISTQLFKYLDGSEDNEINLPISAGDIDLEYRSPYQEDFWVNISGWTTNPKRYFFNKNKEFEFVPLGMWPDYPEFNNIISEVIEVESYDGVKIPMSIVRRDDHKIDASSMAIITAYGAYGIPETPWFHSPLADFVNQGNIYVSAHVRGGGEKGPKWHEGGFKETKQNSWKDLIACSEYLISNKFIHPKKIALNVNSAGGITGGMAVNERPDLFGAFIGFIPKLNPTRIESLDEFDNSDNEYEFGTIKEQKSYLNLLKMDPVVNLNSKNDYPSTLFTIGYRDYLIPPSGPGKYIAFLQTHSDGSKPYLLDVDFDAEHDLDWVVDYAKLIYFTSTELNKLD